MAHIISERVEKSVTETRREYRWTGTSAGFSFDVDAHGNPVRTEGNAHNHDGLAEWVASGELVDLGVIHRTRTWWEEPVLRCDCGDEVYLDGFTNPCDCGRDWNRYGQLLAPRSQWGEDTGETLDEILSIP